MHDNIPTQQLKTAAGTKGFNGQPGLPITHVIVLHLVINGRRFLDQPFINSWFGPAQCHRWTTVAGWERCMDGRTQPTTSLAKWANPWGWGQAEDDDTNAKEDSATTHTEPWSPSWYGAKRSTIWEECQIRSIPNSSEGRDRSMGKCGPALRLGVDYRHHNHPHTANSTNESIRPRYNL